MSRRLRWIRGKSNVQKMHIAWRGGLALPRDRTELGAGLVEALVAMVVILIASAAIFGGLAWMARTNTASAISLSSAQSAMNAWANGAATSPTASTYSESLVVDVHYVAATSGTQSVAVPVSMTESGNGYGWTKVATE